ncbi:hypothetical protein PENTCL1PPCAC_9252, partial [Pristionchus entomophagus]
EHIGGRLIYNSNNEQSKDSLKKKFRCLALYYYSVLQEYRSFGRVVTSSIIRDWPATIQSAEPGNEATYTRDRAPLSVTMKADGSSIRKDGDKYVMRVLALEERDIGTLLMSAHSETELLALDDDGEEGDTYAYVVEMSKEGGGNKRKASSNETDTTKKSRKTKGQNEEKRYNERTHRCGFYYLQNQNGVLDFYSSNQKEDFVDKYSKNVAFTINNISIFDPTIPRPSITQKYIMKSHFEFHFMDHSANTFAVKTVDNFTEELHRTLTYEAPVKSMSFEASSNTSTHWEKTMPFIWSIQREYYQRRNELTQVELASKDALIWIHVKE